MEYGTRIIDYVNKLKFSVNSDVLKLVAIISMTIDHLVKGINFEYTGFISNFCGRIAFPIFGFLIALNLARYANSPISSDNIYKKYLIRLLIFGTITLYLDYWATGMVKYNIMFTFALSVLFIYIVNFIYQQNFSSTQKILFVSVSILWFIQIAIFLEYSTQGVFYIVLFYYFLVCRKSYFLVGLLFFAFFLNEGMLSVFATVITVLFLLLVKEQSFNQKRLFKQWWFFYLYYPAHKTLINLIF